MLCWFQFEYMIYINNYQTEGNHLKIFGIWTDFHFFCIQKEAFHFISRLCQECLHLQGLLGYRLDNSNPMARRQPKLFHDLQDAV